jgi:hypothetical protein
MEEKIKYNIKSSGKYGWTPDWFGAENFSIELIDKIIEFQKEHGLDADGLVGPGTYRRIEADLLSEQDYIPPKRYKRKGEKGIIYNNIKYPIAWDKIILWNERGGFSHPEGTYNDWSEKPDRGPIQFVNHWDAALSSESCAKIINKRGLSMHFLIDNDGTIYQTLDIQHVAWQAGSRLWNTNSIGVEISNAFYTKYQSWYERKGFGPRPIESGHKINNRKIEDHLGFYPVQLEALAALWAAVHNATGMSLDICEVRGHCPDCAEGRHSGFINHFNLTTNKMDCASLNMKEVLEKANISLNNLIGE